MTAISGATSDTAAPPIPEEAAAAETEALIPGLPDEVAEQCLLHLPFPYHSLARSVSSPWNRALSSAPFLRAKAPLHLPHLFVFAFHRHTLRLHWQALDPRSGRWFVLPPMPLSGAASPASLACAAVPRRGELYVLGGMLSGAQSPLRSVLTYRAPTNSWSAAAPMPTPRAFFAAGSIGGRIVASGGGIGDSAVEIYDPAEDRWAPAAGMRCGMDRYDAAVVGRRMYVTEGWTWPFSCAPRGAVYDADGDRWEEMREGMREGWTGASAEVRGRLFVLSECGGGRVKEYDAGRDRWRAVGGGGLPAELRRPYAVAGAEEGRVYVAAGGMDVGVGTVVGESVEWEVVKGPQAFADLVPCSAHVLYV